MTRKSGPRPKGKKAESHGAGDANGEAAPARGPWLSAPEQLALHRDQQDEWNVVIETPKRSRNKYKYDPEMGAFRLTKVLPEGMTFPYDFGFLPRTRAEDGDPVDVLLLMEEPVFCGCVVPAKLIGVIEASQSEEGGKEVRNDRLIAVPVACSSSSPFCDLSGLGKEKVDEIEAFFKNYHRLDGKKFKVLGLRGPGTAQRVARHAVQAKPAA